METNAEGQEGEIVDLGYAYIKGIGNARVLMVLEQPPIANDNLTVVVPVEFENAYEALQAIKRYKAKKIIATYKGKDYIIGSYQGTGKVENKNSVRPHIGFNLIE